MGDTQGRSFTTKLAYWAVLALVVLAAGWLLWTSVGGGRSEDETDADTTTVVTAVVPDVVGMQETEAAGVLEQAGFDVEYETVATDDVEEGVVARQRPGGDETADAGITVTIVVATAADEADALFGQEETETPVVPDVVGMSEEYAESAIDGAGYVMSVSRGYSDDYLPGKVVYQSPLGGVALDPGSWVSITVSLGKRPTPTAIVPHVLGLSESAAKARIAGAGLEAWSSGRPSDQTAGTVFDQWPSAGTSVATDHKVYILVATE